MVKELVRLHNGTITVKSKVGDGSEFTVSLPLINPKISAPSVGPKTKSKSNQTTAYVNEALQWIPDLADGKENNNDGSVKNDRHKHQPTVLLADDNLDMRRYVERLLVNEYKVILAVDGEDALAKAVEFKPDIILSDIMMPKLDGFGLLKKLRARLATSSIPVVFLSARAGEEARIEGILAGADDYLTKPFSSRELLARIGNQILMAEARKKIEHEFFNLFYQAPAHILVMKGPEHLVEFFHPKSKVFTGGRDLTGMKMREGIPEVEGQGYFEMLDSVYQTGKPIYLSETKATLPDAEGKLVDHYFNITYLPWRDLNGNIQGLLQFSFEVTEVVKQRLKSESSERRFRSIAQQAPVAMAVLHGPTHIVDVANDKVLELWGKTYDKVFNKPVLEIFPEIINQGFHDLLKQVYETGNPYVANEMPVIFNRGDKPKKIYVNLLYEALRNEKNEIEGIVAVGTDVTEQVNSRKIIEDAEYKLKNAVELAELGTWHINLDTNFIQYSQRIADWWGLPEEGSPLDHVMACIHADDRQKVASAVTNAIESNGAYEAEYRLINAKTGEERYIQASGKVFYDEEKIPTRLSGIARDVTLHKSLQNELEKLVESRTRQLIDVNTDLLRSNENLRQFAYVASHDLQEPLRKIQTYSDLVNTRNTDSQMIGKEYIEKIASGAKRMSMLIKALLEFSQAERKDELFEKVDLNVTMHNIKNDYEVTIGEKHAVIEIDNLCTVEAIPLQMNQLFYNMVGNALKFSREGKSPIVRVSSTMLDVEEVIRLKLNPDVPYCEVRVKDNGIGFDQKYADQIFVLFQRLHVRDKYEGTGIGLALCKKIVENHKGLLEVESAVGEGTTFKIVLPALRI
jgi:PAS domain S-box-containing protein